MHTCYCGHKINKSTETDAMDEKLIHLIHFLLLTSLIILVICSNNIKDIIHGGK